MSDKTIFQRIIDRELPARFVYEDEEIVAFHDAFPQAPVHVLIVPRKPIPSVDDLEDDDVSLVGRMILLAKSLAEELGLTQGYRLVFNCKRQGGQTVDHLHLHLLGGRHMHWPPG
ncbi:MAG: histidine triad nucleotide-binding protein [Chlorobi bacterium]|nr:histidine triad nucleotide-binding protein [Chlorobiota bacterium]